MKTVEYLKQLEDEVQSLLNNEVFSKCDYSTYDKLTESFGVLFREIDEQRKVIERQQFNDDTTREKMVKPIAIKDPETWEWLCVCGEPIGESQKYCDQCGNKFDWSVRNR